MINFLYHKNGQIQKLRDGAEIVAACPGRLLDLAEQGAVRLTDLEVLIIDEADRMLDLGFIGKGTFQYGGSMWLGAISCMPVKTPLKRFVFRRPITGEPMGQISATFMRTVDELGWNKGVTDGRQNVVFHTLRHSYCSWLAMAGVPLYMLARLSGHETMSMVQRYSHLSPGTSRDAVSRLNGNLKTEGKENLRKEKQHSTVILSDTAC